MKIITVISDDENHEFFLLKLSCAVNDLELMALVTKRKNFQSNRLKDALLISYLEDVNNDEFIFFTDGYDAIFTTGQDEIMAKFARFNKELVFSTETNCWPDESLASSYPETDPSPYKYLNSGGFVGTAGLIKEFLNDNSFTSDKFERSNQYLWTQAFLRNQNLIGLDTSCDIFCSFSPEAGAAYLPKPPENDYYDYNIFMHQWFQNNFIIDKGRIFNKTTNTWPCHAHFNVNSKLLMDNKIRDMILNKIIKSRKIQTLYESN